MLHRIESWRGLQIFNLDKALVSDIVQSAAYLALSFVLNFYAGTFASQHASNSVTDILLDNLPVVNVDLVFVEGALLLWLFVGLLLLQRPERAPFLFKSMALFVLVRSAFIVLTHLGPFPERSALDPSEVLRLFTFGADLFFSGHTGAPFLLALMFWKSPRLRAIFLAASGVFAVSVLLGHLHYSIDVFAAFFISYGTFDLAKVLFPREQILFDRARLPWILPEPAAGPAAALQSAPVRIE